MNERAKRSISLILISAAFILAASAVWEGCKTGDSGAGDGTGQEPEGCKVIMGDMQLSGPGTPSNWRSTPRVLVVIYNPVLEEDENKSLIEYYRWNDPDALARTYISDIKECSYNQVEFQIVERREYDEWPPHEDGFRYTDSTFKDIWSRKNFRSEMFDYVYMLEQNGVKDLVESGQVDEVWLFGFPGMGCWESCMAGTGAIWCNGPIVEGFSCSRSFVIMGFNYERGVDCMLEDLGHRAESILSNVYGNWNIMKGRVEHLWDKFTAYSRVCKEWTACGNVHFAPNSQSDYDWGNRSTVSSTCDDWLNNFPNLTDEMKQVNCDEWGGGDMRFHHKWWFKHFPHHDGAINGKLINWWKYIIEWYNYNDRNPVSSLF